MILLEEIDWRATESLKWNDQCCSHHGTGFLKLLNNFRFYRRILSPKLHLWNSPVKCCKVLASCNFRNPWFNELILWNSIFRIQATRSLFRKHEKQKLLPTPLKVVFHHLMTCLFNIILGFIWLFLPLFLIVSNAIHSVR